jgi:hypothetical protein
VYAGQFAAFNVPYPAWFASLAWAAAATAMLVHARRGGRASLVCAGLAAAAAFSVKLNAGAYAFAACTWIIATTTRAQGRVDRFAAVAATLLTALGVWFSFDFAAATPDAFVHLLPCAALVALAIGPHAHRFASARHVRTLDALAVLAATFSVATGVWALPLLARMGVEAFARDVLLVGSGAADLYHLAYPSAEPYALAVTAALAGFAVVGLLVRRSILPPVPVLGIAALATLAAALALPRVVVMPEGFAAAVVQQLENGAFWVAPLVNVAGIALLATAAARAANEQRSRALAALVPMAVAMYLQLFPRTDFMHVIMGVPLTAVLAGALLARVVAAWAAGRWPRRIDGARTCNALSAAAVLAVVAFEALQSVPGVLAAREIPSLVGSRLAGIGLEAAASDDLQAFGLAASRIAAATGADEAAVSYPATSGLLFTAERGNPLPHDYWFPGRPDHDAEARMVDTLRANPPRAVATLNDGWTFFVDSPGYFSRLRDFLRSHYRLAARYGRFDVLVRADRGDAPRVEHWQPSGARAAAVEASMAARTQAARRWLAALEPADVRPDSLPTEVAAAVLLLRALRDAPDLRTAGLLFAGSESPHRRVVDEALDTMAWQLRNLKAVANRPAGDYDFDELRRFIAPYRERAQRSRDARDSRLAAYSAAVLAVLDGREAELTATLD